MKKSVWIIEQKEKEGYFPLLYYFSHLIGHGPEAIFKATQINYISRKDAQNALELFPKELKYRVRKYTSNGK